MTSVLVLSKLFLLIFSVQYTSSYEEDWVNPMEMKISYKSAKEFVANEENCKKYVEELNELKTAREFGTSVTAGPIIEKKHETIRDELSCVSYLKRFVNVILRGAGLQNKRIQPAAVKKVDLEINITGRELKILQDFADGSDDECLHELDPIILKMFLPTEEEWFNMENLYYSFPKMHLNSEFIITSTCGLLIILFIWFLLSLRSIKFSFIILAVLMFFVSFGWNWNKFYNEEIIRQHVVLEKNRDLPLDCRPWDKAWYQKVYTVFQYEDECEKYLKAKNFNPYFSVPVGKIFSDTFTMLFYGPLKELGSVLSANISGFTDNLAFPFNHIFRFLFTGIGFFLIPIFILLYTRDFSFSLPLFSLQLKAPPKNITENGKETSGVEELPFYGDLRRGNKKTTTKKVMYHKNKFNVPEIEGKVKNKSGDVTKKNMKKTSEKCNRTMPEVENFESSVQNVKDEKRLKPYIEFISESHKEITSESNEEIASESDEEITSESDEEIAS